MAPPSHTSKTSGNSGNSPGLSPGDASPDTSKRATPTRTGGKNSEIANSNGPHTHPGPAASTRTSRTTKLTEHMELGTSKISNADQAREHLYKNCYISKDENTTLSTLAVILNQIVATNSFPKRAADDIISVGKLLEAISDDAAANLHPTIPDIHRLIQSLPERLNHIDGALDRIEDNWRTSKDDLIRQIRYDFLENFPSAAAQCIPVLDDPEHDQDHDQQHETTNLQTNVQNSQDQLEGTSQLEAKHTAQTNSPSSSYANAAARAISAAAAATAIANGSLPLSHSSTVARAELRAKQCVLPKNPPGIPNPFQGLSEIEIFKKLELTLELMGWQAKDRPEDNPEHKIFKGVSIMRSGDILVDMTSARAVHWLQEEPVMACFREKLGGFATARSRMYPVVAEFLPASLDINSKQVIKTIEKFNNYEADSIERLRWIKPVEKRTPGQQTAHAVIYFKNPESANFAIRDGLFISNKRIYARKLLTEPRRCSKCHKYGTSHIAATCQQPHDVCGTCGGQHKTDNCQVLTADTDNHFCVSCQRRGHAAWSRDCPILENRTKKLNEQIPENRYKFFVTHDPQTWILLGQSTPPEQHFHRPHAPVQPAHDERPPPAQRAPATFIPAPPEVQARTRASLAAQHHKTRDRPLTQSNLLNFVQQRPRQQTEQQHQQQQQQQQHPSRLLQPAHPSQPPSTNPSRSSSPLSIIPETPEDRTTNSTPGTNAPSTSAAS